MRSASTLIPVLNADPGHERSLAGRAFAFLLGGWAFVTCLGGDHDHEDFSLLTSHSSCTTMQSRRCNGHHSTARSTCGPSMTRKRAGDKLVAAVWWMKTQQPSGHARRAQLTRRRPPRCITAPGGQVDAVWTT